MNKDKSYQMVFVTFVVTLSLLAQSIVPALAIPPISSQKDNGTLSIKSSAENTSNLFRTQVLVKTSAQWQRLAEMEVVVLEQDEDTAIVLVDGEQLETLARLGFQPQHTNDLEPLVFANGEDKVWLVNSLQPLFAEAARLQQKRTEGLISERDKAHLQGMLRDLTFEQRAGLLQLTSVDDDADGLTNTQETWWCTDSLNPDSDGDGTSDGLEVQAAKDWLSNTAPSYPSTGKPFVGWPPDHAGCYDDDLDSVPDLAETWELGLNINLESTDRDKFDDGQELFGNTYCPGTGGFCGYGTLPRDDDWGVVFSQMPSWVERPGNHPLVAAFPVPELDITPSSLSLEAVTTITTDHVVSEGEQHSYSTSKAEGTSSSVANTEIWNNWQETSLAIPQGNNQLFITQNNVQINNNNAKTLKYVGHGLAIVGAVGSVACVVATGGLCLPLAAAGLGGAALAFGADALEDADELQDTIKANRCDPDAPYVTPKCLQSGLSQLEQQEYVDMPQTMSNQTSSYKGDGTYYHSTVDQQIVSQPVYQMNYLLPRQQIIQTDSTGYSWGGELTTTTTEFEEHTITNGNAFSSEESWGTATAIDSAHAADLRFTYKVSNTGTEYAREICDLAFNIYIGNNENPAYTYFVADDVGGDGCFNTFMPDEKHTYASVPIPLSLEQMKAIDLGGSIRITVEDFTYGIDELFYEDASNAGAILALEDGTDDGDEAIDTYLIPTWGEENVLDVMARYFPHETDAGGGLKAIWTPEYRSDTPNWCVEPQVVGSGSQRTLWCKHALSVADWWNIYLNGLGDGSLPLQNTPASPGSVALFRFNRDSDLDGYSDRTEWRLGTEAKDAADFPQPELIAGLHSLQNGNYVTSTLSFLNTDLYDAYGIEAVMIAPNPSISITNNTVGGSGRVRGLQPVVVGSRILPPAYDNTTWSGTAQPFSTGYYTGVQNHVYSFTALQNGDVSAGTLQIAWDDGLGSNGTLDIGTGYASPSPLAVGNDGLQVGFISGDVQVNDTFTVAANIPADTFQYQIQSQPAVNPVVLVSYNDPQGNHRFVTPITLTNPTENLVNYSGQMLVNLGAEIVTQAPITTSGNYTTDVVVNWPAAVTLEDAHLFLEFVNISGTVTAEIPVTTTIQSGPNVVSIPWDTNVFSPTFYTEEDYIVMVFWTDWQGNIIDTSARPLSSFQQDPQAVFDTDETILTWDFGTARQGTLMQRRFVLASVGFRDLLTYMGDTPGITLAGPTSSPLSPADMGVYTMTINTEYLPVGPFTRTIPIRTSDPANPTQEVVIQGDILPFTPDDTQSVTIRPLDWLATITGTHNAGEWVTYTHNLGPNPQTLHPLKVYSQDYTTFWGVGKYATDFGQGTASANMFGNGSDGDLLVTAAQTHYTDDVREILTTIANVGQDQINVADGSVFDLGDDILIIQMQGTGAGNYEFGIVAAINGNVLTLQSPLLKAYSVSGNSKAQVIQVPNYQDVTVQGSGLLTAHAWNGSTGGIVAFRATGTVTVESSGVIGVTGKGFTGGVTSSSTHAEQGDSATGNGTNATSRNGTGGGGGALGDGAAAGGGGGGGLGTVGTAGQPGARGGGVGGATGGDATLTELTFGGAGGGGGHRRDTGGGTGGSSGGIIFISAQTVILEGASSIISAGNAGHPKGAGGDSAGGGGGGAGGSILLRLNSGSIMNNGITALGGNGGAGNPGSNNNGGAAGNGRIRIEYCESLSGSTNPPASTEQLDCYIVEQVETAPYDQALLNLPEAITGSRSYNIQYGRQYTFTTAGEQIQQIHLPKQLYTSMSLDALINNTASSSGPLSLALDFGNDGTFDWNYNATTNFPASIVITDVVDGLNAYLVSQTSVPWGSDIDVPVRVQIDQQADLFLTNLALNLQFNQPGEGLLSTVNVAADRPLDWLVTISGTHSLGDWITYTHALGPNAQTLHPVRVYSLDFSTLWGVGKYATDFSYETVPGNLFGDGSDGDLTILSGQTAYVDHVRSVLALSANSNQSDLHVADTTGFVIGKEILIIQMQGTGTGGYEFARITGINGNIITIGNELHNEYIADGNSKSQIIQVPHYQNIIIQSGGTLRSHAWNGSTGGVVVFRTTGFLMFSGGLLDALGDGYRGGPRTYGAAQHGYQGEGLTGTGSQTRFPNNGGGGGGPGTGDGGAGAGGGSHASAGSDAKDPFYGDPGLGSQTIIGESTLVQLFFGGAGGAGGTDDSGGGGGFGGRGGNGGGIIIIASRQILGSGTITANGEAGEHHNGSSSGSEHGGGGGGAGGSIKLITGDADLSGISTNAVGGLGGKSKDGNGGVGGVGRIRVEYCNTFSGSTNPLQSSKNLDCFITDQVELSPYDQGQLNLPEDVNGSQSYIIQYGRRYTFTAANSHTDYLRLNRQVYGSVNLEALVSNTGVSFGNLDFCLDIGDNSSCDYAQNSNINFPATITITGIISTLNNYLLSRNDIAWGDPVDVPVSIQVDRQADVILTNLALTPVGVKTRYLRLPAQAYDNVSLDLLFTQTGVSNGPLAFTVDVGADGTTDWSFAGTSVFPATVTSPNLGVAFTDYLVGQAGEVDVPIRIVPSPFIDTALVAAWNASVNQPDATLSTDDINFSNLTPTESNTVTVTATLHNNGLQDSGGITAAFFATTPDGDEWYIGSSFVENIIAGSSNDTTIQWNTTGFTGTVPVRVVIDPYNRLLESSENNNEATANLTIYSRPDLRINSIVFSDQEPVISETITVTIGLLNSGQTTANATSHQLYNGNPDGGGTLLATQSSNNLIGGSVEMINFTWTPTTPGPYQLFLKLDSEEDVNESNESNNLEWQDIYVGFAGPILLNSGDAGTDPAYTNTLGYGYVDTGQPDILSSCGSSGPEHTLRQDAGGKVIYQFDHLQPGHFYHLDFILNECDGAGRQESIYVDGNLIAGPEDLSDGSTHRLSLRLDPALYIDHSISVTIEAPGIDGSIVNAVYLYDIDYRYADSGGGEDPSYPGNQAYGWLDGTANINWGILPYQSVRVDLGDNTLRYQFDKLTPGKYYAINLTFWQPSGAGRLLKVQIDGQDSGYSADTSDYQIHRDVIQVPNQAYADASIVVDIIRTDAATGPFVNEIALEELTLLEIATVQGEPVLLQGQSNHSGTTISLWDGPTMVISATTDTSGHYTLNVPAGTYDIWAYHELYLNATCSSIELSNGSTLAQPGVTLQGGDSNGDNVINILDLSFLGSRFGLMCGNPNWDYRADINSDCTVNILDITMAGNNFTSSGPLDWCP